MALGDLILSASKTSDLGGRLYNVALGTPIYAGDPVQQVLGGTVVFPAITNWPVVGTTYAVGVAQTTATNTSSAAGTVVVTPVSSNDTWLANPDTAASWDTQTEYNALVGSRVLLKNSASSGGNSGTYTILASDSANNGCVVLPLDVFVTPGKVAFAFRGGTSYLG